MQILTLVTPEGEADLILVFRYPCGFRASCFPFVTATPSTEPTTPSSPTSEGRYGGQLALPGPRLLGLPVVEVLGRHTDLGSYVPSGWTWPSLSPQSSKVLLQFHHAEGLGQECHMWIFPG